MLGWSPLWESIIESSIWREPDHVLRLWVFFLARKDRDGFVPYRSPAVMADITKIVDVRKYEEALGRLMAPDPNSTTAACGGRRIIGVDGGWRIVNHELYRDKINKEYRREYQRIKQAEYRAKLKEASNRKPVRRGRPTAAEAVAGKVLAGGGTVEEAEAAVDGMRPGEWPAGHRHDGEVLGGERDGAAPVVLPAGASAGAIDVINYDDGRPAAYVFPNAPGGVGQAAPAQPAVAPPCPAGGPDQVSAAANGDMPPLGRDGYVTPAEQVARAQFQRDRAMADAPAVVEPETDADDGERDPFKEDGE